MFMVNKYKKYMAFFAAVLNIISSGLYYDASGKQYSDPDTVNAALATWFFGVSLLLWILYVVAYFVSKKK